MPAAWLRAPVHAAAAFTVVHYMCKQREVQHVGVAPQRAVGLQNNYCLLNNAGSTYDALACHTLLAS